MEKQLSDKQHQKPEAKLEAEFEAGTNQLTNPADDTGRRKPKAILLDDNSASAASGKTAHGAHSSPQPARKPRAADTALGRSGELVILADDIANGINSELTPPPLDISKTKRFSWATALFAALGGLVSLAIGLWLDQLLRDLFSRNDFLGWLALGLTIIALVAFIIIILRELIGIMRMRRINHLREETAEALKGTSLKSARKLVASINNICADLPQSAQGRAILEKSLDAVIDPIDLIQLAETSLMSPLDRKARTLVLNTAKRVSLVTAISPRALVDVIYVMMENLRLIRALSELYGGRPGSWGLMKLARMIITHLAATGAIAVGDGLVQQFLGHGIAAKLSKRLGEGVINGLLTARIGIASMDICRPMPFYAARRPGVSDFMQELLALSNDADKRGQTATSAEPKEKY